MTELLILGLVAAGTYFFLKAIWNYEIRVAKTSNK
jgi:hypothetical protein